MGNCCCLAPPFFEGAPFDNAPGVYLRSVGEWLSWEGGVSAQNLSMATREVGDVLVVFGCGVAGFTGPTVANWTRIDRHTGNFNTVFHMRVATGDSNDNFAVPEIVTPDDTGGQGGGMYQMGSIAGLTWTTPDKVAGGENAVRNQDLLYPACIADVYNDTIVLIGGHKEWGTAGKDPYPAGGIGLSIDGGIRFEFASAFKYQQGEDREIVGVWAWRYDEGSPTAVTASSFNQTPLDDDAPNAGSCYSLTTRARDNP